MIRAIGVVVPVHDEAAHLPACLAALDGARSRVGVPVHTVLVLDSCRDGSAAIAGAWAGPGREVVTVAVKNVGHARAVGMHRALTAFAPLEPRTVWLASTDADSTVPEDWLTQQLEMAAGGAEAVAGSIRVSDWSEWSDRGGAGGGIELGERFLRFYDGDGDGDGAGADSHPHVHGANLGVRADAYLAAGGFAPLVTGEDHALWRALAQRPRRSPRRLTVTTSARRRARAPEGFSSFLGNFAEETSERAD